jgi:hypothetical protein
LLNDLADGGHDRRLRTPLDREYLKWRFAEPPGLDYRCLFTPEGGGAAVVFRARIRRRWREIVVSQILARSARASLVAVEDLLSTLAHHAGADYLVAVASPRTPERSALVSSGFLPLPTGGPKVTVRSLTDWPDLPPPERLQSWRFEAGLLEIF